jgi:dienelactone hydrolase
MKLFRAVITLAAFVFVLGTFSSCALHPCARMEGRQDPHDFVFRKFQGKKHVYPTAITRPAGAPILVLHGLCGLDGATLDWGKTLSRHGWKVYMPMLNGEFDRCDPLAHSVSIKLSGNWKTSDPFASGQVLDDMGVVADQISALHGGKPLVVVGNCLTGSFPLALLSRPSVKTAVLCQPALPLKSAFQVLFKLPQSAKKRRALAIPPEQLNKSLRALHDPSKRLYGFHYLEDPLASMDKFYWLHDALNRQGISSKFRPVVLVPAHSPAGEKWWITMKTPLKHGMITPHVTVTGGEEVDRTPLRKLFNEMIRP